MTNNKKAYIFFKKMKAFGFKVKKYKRDWMNDADRYIRDKGLRIYIADNIDNSSFNTGDLVLFADLEFCFDKLMRCPVVMSMPQTDQEFKLLKDELNFLLSPEGFKKAREHLIFGCEDKGYTKEYFQTIKNMLNEKDNSYKYI